MQVLETNGQTTLQHYPCEYLFKAFGSAEQEVDFAAAVYGAINRVLPVSREAIKHRPSSNGRYLCVTVVTYLHNDEQRQMIYRLLQQIEGLKYLL